MMSSRRVKKVNRRPRLRRVNVASESKRVLKPTAPSGTVKALTIYKTPPPSTTFVSTSGSTPDRAFVRLKYLEPAYNTGALTGASAYVDYYRINSVFDPYAGVGGGQPAGLARMFAQYLYCRVISASIKVIISRIDHEQDYSYDFALIPLPYSAVLSPPTSYSQFVEQPYSKWFRGVSVYADQPHVMRQTVSVPKLHGVLPTQLGEPNWFTTASANPTFDARWAVIVLQPIAGVNNTNLQIEVGITYDCEFFMRGTVPGAYYENKAFTTAHAEMLREQSTHVSVVPMAHKRSVLTLTSDSKEGTTPPGGSRAVVLGDVVPRSKKSSSVKGSIKIATTTTPSTVRMSPGAIDGRVRNATDEDEDVESLYERVLITKQY